MTADNFNYGGRYLVLIVQTKQAYAANTERCVIGGIDIRKHRRGALIEDGRKSKLSRIERLGFGELVVAMKSDLHRQHSGRRKVPEVLERSVIGREVTHVPVIAGGSKRLE